jgi:hypothetical protein
MGMRIVAFLIILNLLRPSEVRPQAEPSQFAQSLEVYSPVRHSQALHLVFNQPKFSPRDTIWFKAYLFDADFGGVNGKQLIHTNLVDSEGRVLQHFNFNVNDGVGHNQLILRDTLSPGVYLLTAHTDWIKRFAPAHLFTKEILVVRENRIERSMEKTVTIGLEGGHLVGSCLNNVSIMGARPGGEVQLTDRQGEVMATSVLDRNGTCQVAFKPNPNADYVVRVNGGKEEYPLSMVENDGLSLHLDTPLPGEDSLKLTLWAPLASVLRNETLYLLVTARGKVRFETSLTLGPGESTQIMLPSHHLSQGVAHISILTGKGQLLASRDFYIPESDRIGANIKLTQRHFHPGDLVSFQVALSDEKGLPVEGEFSVKVINQALFEEPASLLTEELIGGFYSAGDFAVDRSKADWLSSIDNFLITNTKPLPWNEIMNDSGAEPEFHSSGQIRLRGTAYDAETMEPMPRLTRIMFYLQRYKRRYQTFTTENGEFGLELLDFSGQDELFYLGKTPDQTLHKLKIRWKEDTFALPAAPAFTELPEADRYGTFANNTGLINSSYAFFAKPDTLLTDFHRRKGSQFDAMMKEADYSYEVEDYVTLPTMEEFIKEVVKPLFVRQRKQGTIVRSKQLQNIDANADPLYIIDGIATLNTDFFLSLKPSDLVSLKVVQNARKLSYFGFMGENGIVIVQTKAGNVREPLDDPSRLIDGLNRQLDFPAGRMYEEGAAPTFRSTIYWNPTIRTGSTGKADVMFHCTDDIGVLNIVVEGVATGGHLFSQQLDIEVLPSIR